LAVFWHGLGLVLMLSPLILFDLRHGFITSRAFFDYLLASATGGKITADLEHWTVGEKVVNLLGIFTKAWWLQLSLVAAVGVGLKKLWQKGVLKLTVPNLLSLLFISMTIFYFFYNGYLYTYYLVIPVTLGMMFLAVALAAFPSLLISSLLVVAVSIDSLLSLQTAYLPKFRTIPVLSRITHEIERHLDQTQPSSFAIFKDSRDGLTSLGYEYRFLLQRDGYLPAGELEYNLAEVLYVIQEDGDADPLTLGNWEVTQFAPTTAEKISTLRLHDKTVKIFALYRVDLQTDQQIDRL
jgi:hypothetical protein